MTPPAAIGDGCFTEGDSVCVVNVLRPKLATYDVDDYPLCLLPRTPISLVYVSFIFNELSVIS